MESLTIQNNAPRPTTILTEAIYTEALREIEAFPEGSDGHIMACLKFIGIENPNDFLADQKKSLTLKSKEIQKAYYLTSVMDKNRNNGFKFVNFDRGFFLLQAIPCQSTEKIN